MMPAHNARDFLILPGSQSSLSKMAEARSIFSIEASWKGFTVLHERQDICDVLAVERMLALSSYVVPAFQPTYPGFASASRESCEGRN